MNQYISFGYARSRMDSAARRAATSRPADEWSPRPRGPGLFDRVGHRLVAVGAGMIRDRGMLEKAAADVMSKAA